jgi:hypothetical protein
MSMSAFLKGISDRILSRNIVYFVFPIVLIIALYFAFLPFNQTYIGDWHDIFANSFYYSLVEKNYFVTWNDLGVGGFPLTASPGSDKYYLFSFPFYLVFQSMSVVNYLMLLHLLIAYFAFYQFGSLLTKNDNALLIFSLFFAFSGLMLGRVAAGHHLLLYGLAWIPLLYYFFFKIVLFNEPVIKNALGMSIVSALMYFTGDLYHVVFAYFVILAFFVYFVFIRNVSRQMLCLIGISLFLTLLLVSVKGIPDLGVSPLIQRVDPINPLAGGGSLENDIASFVSGVRIDSVWTQAESGVMMGIIPLLLAIIALLYGRKDIAVPSFFVILLSVVWADGGKNILAFIHLFPLFSELRNPGRVFGALLPIILFLALYGSVIVYKKYKDDTPLEVSPDQRKMILIGIALLIVVKLFELPFQEIFSPETAVMVLLVAGFVALLYSGKGTVKNILWYLVIAGALNLIFLLRQYPFPGTTALIQLLTVILLCVFLYVFIQGFRVKTGPSGYLCALLLAGIVLMILGNLGSGYVTVTDPGLDTSPAPELIEKIKSLPGENSQIWVFNNGWPNKHMDFTYWYFVNKIHDMNYYSPYSLKDLPPLGIAVGGVYYNLPDYLVDTGYLENGNQNIQDFTFKVRNISVYKLSPVLPTVSLIRDNQLIPLTTGKYSPGDVTASGPMHAGDIIVLKTVYFPGWKANGIDAAPYEHMVSVKLAAPTEKISFVFDPVDYRIGAILSGCGIVLLLILLLKRKTLDRYLAKFALIPKGTASAGRKKGKRHL